MIEREREKDASGLREIGIGIVTSEDNTRSNFCSDDT